MSLKRLAHPLIKVAYRAVRAWGRLTGQPLRGAAVALWHGGQLLVVRHSYRPGYSLPGGFLRRGEDPRLAACREILEELAVVIAPQDLVLVTDEPAGRYHEHIFECHAPERPRIRIDNWEIIEAEFVDPDRLVAGDYRLAGNLRRARQILFDRHALWSRDRA
jgi:ADP-ribose pyrophosphatase YjhB (NUDIX family)